MSAEAIAEAQGFELLGNIELATGGKIKFPKPPQGGGLYFLRIYAGGNYIGECKSYGPDVASSGTKISGRFKDYTDPKDDIWTELVINAMLKKGRGGKVYLLPSAGESKDRKALEREKIATFRKLHVPLWNSGVGRDEKAYLSYKMPILERRYETVTRRYTTHRKPTPYRERRLANLKKRAHDSRAKAKDLGLRPEDYVSVDRDDIVIVEPPAVVSNPLSAERQANDLNRSDHKATSKKREAAVPRDRSPSAASSQSLVHRYMAGNRDASLEKVLAGRGNSLLTVGKRSCLAECLRVWVACGW